MLLFFYFRIISADYLPGSYMVELDLVVICEAGLEKVFYSPFNLCCVFKVYKATHSTPYQFSFLPDG
jgi:hypothetical protein